MTLWDREAMRKNRNIDPPPDLPKDNTLRKLWVFIALMIAAIVALFLFRRS